MDPVSADTVRRACAQEGLDQVAVLAPLPARLDPAGFDRLLADGVGDMAWLGAGRERRLDPRIPLPDGSVARSVLVAAWPVWADPPPGELRRARYVAGKEHHRILRHKLHRALAAAAPDFDRRAVCDSAPVNERSLARLAGLGWIGRNALVISPRRGSWFVLGLGFTSAWLEPFSPGHDAFRCGSCRRCERICPTGALVEGRLLSVRCISYLTIEHQGVIPRALAAHMRGWWFGCDLCQEVCPWNRFAPAGADPRLRGGEEGDLLAISADGFDRRFAGRAIRRLGFPRFRRNLLAALFSLGRHAEVAGFDCLGLDLVERQRRELVVEVRTSADRSGP